MNGYTYFTSTNAELNFTNFLKNKKFKKLSIASRAVYGILFDAMISKGRPDRNGHIFITYTIKQLMSDLSVSKQTAINYIAELTKAGLIKKYKRGLGQPSLIYVMNTNSKRQEKSSGQESIHSEVKEIDPINNINIHTSYSINDKLNNINNTSNPIQSDKKMDYDFYMKKFQEKLDVESLKAKRPSDGEMIDSIVEIIADTMVYDAAKITVASRSVSIETVKQRLNRLKSEHVEYVIECFNNTKTTIRNVSKYILASLYNAPATYTWYAKNIKHKNEKQEKKSDNENESREKKEIKSKIGPFGNFDQRDYDMQQFEKMLLDHTLKSKNNQTGITSW